MRRCGVPTFECVVRGNGERMSRVSHEVVDLILEFASGRGAAERCAVLASPCAVPQNVHSTRDARLSRNAGYGTRPMRRYRRLVRESAGVVRHARYVRIAYS